MPSGSAAQFKRKRDAQRNDKDADGKDYRDYGNFLLVAELCEFYNASYHPRHDERCNERQILEYIKHKLQLAVANRSRERNYVADV